MSLIFVFARKPKADAAIRTLKSTYFIRIIIENRTFQERIATPVCGLVRND